MVRTRDHSLQQEYAALRERYERLSRHAAELDAAFKNERRRAARNAAIARIGRLISSSLSLRTIFQTAVEAIHEHLDFAYIAAGVIDPDDPAFLRLIAHTGIYARDVPPDYRHSIHLGIVGEAVRARRQIIVSDVTGDERYLSLVGPTIRSELATPIVMGERLLGVLNIEAEEPISEEDAEGIAVIANQLAVALDHAYLFEQTRHALDESRLMVESSQRISSAMTVEEVILAYLEQVARRQRFTCTIVLDEFDARGERVAVNIRGTWSQNNGPRLLDIRQPYARDLLDPMLDAGQTVVISDIDSDPRVSESLRDMQHRDGQSALAMIPLIARDERIGLVILSHATVYDWPDAELQPYQATAAQLATAIDSRRQHQLLFEQGRRIAVLEERRRLARELHDSVTQSLFSMSLLTQVMPDIWELDQDEAREMLLQIRDLTRGALAEMRALLFELRPAALGEQELAQALHHHAAVFQQRTGIAVIVEADETPALPPDVEHALFRIAQEALANVARHARARRVRVVLEVGPPVRLRISDDGQGFNPDKVARGRLGLVSIRERAASVQAAVNIVSGRGQGTEVVVEWPQPLPIAGDMS